MGFEPSRTQTCPTGAREFLILLDVTVVDNCICNFTQGRVIVGSSEVEQAGGRDFRVVSASYWYQFAVVSQTKGLPSLFEVESQFSQY